MLCVIFGCLIYWVYVSRNYVLQHVLGLHDPVCTASICFLLRGSYVLLSSQKGGSHVVEKCLNSPWMDYAILDFLKCDRLLQLARDRYGNYVIQTALKATKVYFLNSIAFEITRFCGKMLFSSLLHSSGQAIPFYT